MKSTNFGAQPKGGGLTLELLYVATAIAVAIAISAHIPRIQNTTDTRFPACFIDICFA